MEQQTHPAFSYSIPERSWLEVPKKTAQSSCLKFEVGFYKKLSPTGVRLPALYPSAYKRRHWIPA